MTKRRVEPFVWLSFSGGGVLTAVFLPILVFLFGLAFPLGWMSAPDHGHLQAVASNPLTLVFLLGLFVLALIHAAHRLRFALQHGLGLDRSRRPLARLCYSLAVAGTVATVLVLWAVATA